MIISVEIESSSYDLNMKHGKNGEQITKCNSASFDSLCKLAIIKIQAPSLKVQ